MNHGWAIYDLLFGVNAKQEPKPQMAEGYTLSDDGRVYTVKLRDGLKFHNGEPVRAQDCAPSLKRWAARETIGQTVWQYVDECSALDDRTLKITLKQPISIFIDAIARGGASVAFMMPEHVATTDPFKQINDTTGSGPYKFLPDEFVIGTRAAYARNPDYVPRREPAEWMIGGKVTHFDRIEWRAIPDPATAAAALQTGEVDWYEMVEPDLVPLMRRDPDIDVGLHNPTGYNAVMRFNHLHPPFDDVAVRRAVMMGVNQTDYMETVTGGDATAYRTCKSMFPCGSRYGQEIGADVMQGDVGKATAMLRASGYSGEKAVLLNPTDVTTIGQLGNVTYDLLRKIGMNVEMVATDWGTVVQRRVSREPVEKGGWSVLHTWGPSTIRYTPMENSQIRGLGATGWFGWFKDDTIEMLTRRFVEASTDAERDAIALEIHRRAFAMVPCVPLGMFQIHTAYRANLAGVVPGTGPYFWNVRRV
ncbi:ABC transporter substrate-binding protein [Acidisphaera sp. S103]|uniref:ABC transporter substrate-binding protein n=1 Tax=Acidisphaera sp. S103 TaxID=1747223 RepID=UPI0020B1693F|nr:ABC transporter substrate-binding protein [Acidisphaera sp. S103]